MENPLISFPDTLALATGLGRVFQAKDRRSGEIHILNRQANPYSRSYPSEIVTIRGQGGGEEKLFCKYVFCLSDDHRDYGSRGGLAYEAKVYDKVLRSSGMTVPIYHGTYHDPATGAVWLILQHLDNSEELKNTAEAVSMEQAAAWIGRFHAAQARRLAHDSLSFIKRYDADYYRGWARRTVEFARTWHQRLPWLDQLCVSFEEVAAMFLSADLTVIHGEYYPANILIHDRTIYPVDWESAAIGVGEIDLAALTDGWPADLVQGCQRAYRQARWPDRRLQIADCRLKRRRPLKICNLQSQICIRGEGAGFDKMIAAAQVYLQLRWLGSQPDWSADQDTHWRVEDLADAARRLGLIAADGG